jgi:cobalt-zinc-cadmium resistance protein CzcA
MRFNELMTGAKQDVVVKIYGEDLKKLETYAKKIGKLSKQIEGVQDVYIEEMTGSPQMIVSYNRDALAKYNCTIEDVNRAINISYAGQAAGIFFDGERRFDLVVRLDSSSRASIDDLKTINIPSPLGLQIPLSQLATIDFVKAPNQIQRDEAKRRIIVGFNVRGRDVSSIVEELKSRIDQEVNFESGYYPTYGGTFKNLENASIRLLVDVPIALFLIFDELSKPSFVSDLIKENHSQQVAMKHLLLPALLPIAAQACENPFGYSYLSETLAAVRVEYVQWATGRFGRDIGSGYDGRYRGFDLRSEIES